VQQGRDSPLVALADDRAYAYMVSPGTTHPRAAPADFSRVLCNIKMVAEAVPAKVVILFVLQLFGFRFRNQ
jgi:hypothetical protein